MNLDLDIVFKIISIIGVLAALYVYWSNSKEQKRQRVIENTERYHRLHQVAFSEDSYPTLNVSAMERGEYKRDLSNEDMELKLNRFLGDMEWLALFQNSGAVPSSINAYMVGYFAMHIFPQLTDREKAEPHWVLAIDFLKKTSQEAQKLREMDSETLLKYIKINHFH